ncbi:MAG: signal recognition particle protein [Firmicutes bacterium]|nr:signal recognition particle protein [Bacillota bacterium]
MLGNLSEKLQNILRQLRGKGRLSEKDVDVAMREIRLALLEADVNFRVVKDFIASVRERSVGEEVLKSLTPGQQVVKIVHQELTGLLGEKQSRLSLSSSLPAIMLVGLQGSGKTTTAVKLANYLRRQGRRPLLAAADTYRPGAVEQLRVLSESAGLTCYDQPGARPVEICTGACRLAEREGYDPVIFDTAGRLHLDQEMMAELQEIKGSLNPEEVLLVIDAMTGQDAVNTSVEFNRQIGLTGVILTKLDGDARGGAALSVRAVTGCPLKFVGVGEKVDALEPFYPERMASRILGMGDMLTLIEKAGAELDLEKARQLEQKLRRSQFTFDDFREQLEQLRRMGPLQDLVDMLPGAGLPKGMKQLPVDEGQLGRVEAIISSMTRVERRDPSIINSSRRRRIAAGSGTKIQDVNRLLQQFSQMQRMFKQIGGMGKRPQFKRLKKGKRGKGFPFR